MLRGEIFHNLTTQKLLLFSYNYSIKLLYDLLTMNKTITLQLTNSL